MTDSKLQLVIISGMSGAGKTAAMQSLEDAGFYCVDNLPPQLIPKFSNLLEHSAGHIQKVALVIDLRARDFFDALPDALDQLEKIQRIQYQMIFLEATDQVLVSRYKQTRRRHPLASGNSPLTGIQAERKLLEPLKERAHIVLDTSELKPVELKEKIAKHFSGESAEMNVTVMSFGFKYGIPLDADLVFDVRFLPNPHYVDTLRPKTGMDKEVADYVFQWEQTKSYVNRLSEFLLFSLPQYKQEGKQQLVVAIGCTGGKHRSVAITEQLGKTFAESYSTKIYHRDAMRDKGENT